MNRRTFLGGLTLGTLSAPLAAQAQQPTKIFRVGFLSPNSHHDPGMPDRLSAFWQGLRELGYVEGLNIFIEYRWAQRDHGRLPELAADLVRLKVDVIVAPVMESIVAAKQATSTIPIVMVFGIDAVAQRLIESVARPGGNVTGLAWDPSVQIAEKYLEILRDLFPRLSRVANLVDAGFPGLAPYSKAVSDAAQRLRLTFLRVEIRGPDDLEKAFGFMRLQNVEGVVVFGSPMVFRNLRQIVDLAAKHQMPATYIYREAVALGGLASYGIDLSASYRRAATYVARSSRAPSPPISPWSSPRSSSWRSISRPQRHWGLTVPQSLLIRADEVIQ